MILVLTLSLTLLLSCSVPGFLSMHYTKDMFIFEIFKWTNLSSWDEARILNHGGMTIMLLYKNNNKRQTTHIVQNNLYYCKFVTYSKKLIAAVYKNLLYTFNFKYLHARAETYDLCFLRCKLYLWSGLFVMYMVCRFF